jgi:predicted nucleic acid-binding protein
VTRVLLDINVVLDVLTNRPPFADDAAALLALVERKEVEGLIAAHTVTTLHYLLSKHLGKAQARRILSDLLHILRVVSVDEDRLRHALALNWPDFEDAVQAACADTADADCLITRDKKGFKKAPVKTLTPAEFLALLS